ncbi:hypothetical protein [Candidatus Scalindua japonica]|uniref:hypothetical protein n=1 Tax=Candidatus Scalindua japonica TaxID=1284222 RepID=UPI000BDF0A69|nr:hypothetical protein [Candidatus Scalindua japonica]
MLITPHVLLGAAISRGIGSLLCGLPLAFASHFALDAIPNWDVGLTSIKNIGIIITDGIIALLLIRFLSITTSGRPLNKILLWTGGLFGILPDILSQSGMILAIRRIPFENFHQSIQKSALISWSLPVQIFLSFTLFRWIYSMQRYAVSSRKIINYQNTENYF